MNSKPSQNGIILNDSEAQLKTCPFCLEGKGGDYGFYEHKVKNIFQTRIITSNILGSVMLLPDLSPLKKGHILICSKEHIDNFASTDNLSLYQSFDIAIKKYSSILSKDEELIFYEHGSSSCISKNGCVQHAHLHVVPINKGFFTEIINSIKEHGLLNNENITEFRLEYDWLKKNTDGHHYILFGKYDQEHGFRMMSAVAGYIPSQLVRYILADILFISPHIKNYQDRENAFVQTLLCLSENINN